MPIKSNVFSAFLLTGTRQAGRINGPPVGPEDWAPRRDPAGSSGDLASTRVSILIEDKASGTQLIQELVQEGLHAVTRYQPQSNKIMRMHAQTAMIENGLVRLPETAPWLALYLHELTAFPKAGTTTRSTRQHNSSIGSSAAAAPAPMPGSGICIRAVRSPAGRWFPARAARTAVGYGEEVQHPPSVVIVQQEPEPNGEAAWVKRQHRCARSTFHSFADCRSTP